MSGHSPTLAPELSPDLPAQADTPTADSPADPRGRAYRQARRHSGRVRLLKITIPAGALVAAGLVVGVTVFNPFGKGGGLTLGPVSLSGSKIAMESPRLTGFRKDAKPYEVTATAAFQDVRRPNVIELKDMRARLATDDAGAFAHLVSNLGLFDTSKDHLELKDDIRITTDKGDEVLLRTASVDFKAGTVVSTDPVRITTASGTVEAEGVRVSDNGHTFSFTGRVRTEFRRDLAEPPARQGALLTPAAVQSPSPTARSDFTGSAVAAVVPAVAATTEPASMPSSPGQPGSVRPDATKLAGPQSAAVTVMPPRRVREAEAVRR